MIYNLEKQAFTIVELIVVITILAILWTIWFISFSSHLVWTRDTNRLEQLSSIHQWLDTYSTQYTLPMPESYVEVRASWSVIWYQWYIWKNILWQIWYSKWWKDPKDEQSFSYYLTEDKKYFQLLWFLEDQSNLQTYRNPLINQTKAVDYSKRYPTVIWKKLGILTESWTNSPIQEVSTIILAKYLDIVTTTNSYNAIFSDQEIISWTWATINILEKISMAWSIQNSCKDYLSKVKTLVWKDGYYYIYSWNWLIQTYCDMTTDWWWWTMFSSNYGWHAWWTPTSWNSFFWKLTKTTMGNMIINNLNYNWIMLYRFWNNNYIVFDKINSNLFNAELKDKAGETSSNITAQTNLWKTRHKWYVNWYTFDKDSNNTIFEVHRWWWNPASWTNWLLESWTRWAWAWVVNPLSLWNHWYIIKNELWTNLSAPAWWYWLFFR